MLMLSLAIGAGVAGATDEAAGLPEGAEVPRFKLPVVNKEKFTDARSFGPGKWVGPAGEKKLLVMSFFATYCEPCKKEMPELVRLYDTYKDQGLGVMLVSIDKGKDKQAEVVELTGKNNVAFPVVHDRFQVVARRYKAERLPYMLMVGQDGVIKTVHVGYTDELKASLENEVRGHLGLEPLAAASPEDGAATDEDEVAKEPTGKKKKKKKSKRKRRKKKS